MTTSTILNRFKSRLPAAARFRLGAVLLLLGFGWPLILPCLLSLAPSYIEFEYNTLPALVWVWFPTAVTLGVGLLIYVVPGVRELRAPFGFTGTVAALVVLGGLRLAYEHGLDLTVRTGLLGSHAIPSLLHVLAREQTTSRVTYRSKAARNDLLFLGHRAVPKLIAALKSPEAPVRTSAAGVLAQLGSEAEDAKEALTDALTDPDLHVRSAAADALLRVAPSAKFNVDSLIHMLNGGQDLDRNSAAIALRDLGPQAAKAVPALTRTLKDSYWAVRVNSANALGSIGPGAASAVPALTEALKDSEPRVQSSAAAALKQIKPAK
jgi:hypothetical protein